MLSRAYQAIPALAKLDYGGMIRAHTFRPEPDAVVDIRDVAHRFRESPQAINDALLLLRNLGCADPTGRDGCWRLRLASSPRNRTDQNRRVQGLASDQ